MSYDQEELDGEISLDLERSARKVPLPSEDIKFPPDLDTLLTAVRVEDRLQQMYYVGFRVDVRDEEDRLYRNVPPGALDPIWSKSFADRVTFYLKHSPYLVLLGRQIKGCLLLAFPILWVWWNVQVTGEETLWIPPEGMMPPLLNFLYLLFALAASLFGLFSFIYGGITVLTNLFSFSSYLKAPVIRCEDGYLRRLGVNSVEGEGADLLRRWKSIHGGKSTSLREGPWEWEL